MAALFGTLTDSTKTYTSSKTILIFGKTGSGIKATANSILGRQEFQTIAAMTSSSEREIIRAETYRNGERIVVIPVPDLVSQYYEDRRAIQDALTEWTPVKPDAALLVIQANVRYTIGQYNIYLGLRNIMGEDITSDNLIVVFTHGKYFTNDVIEKTSDEFLRVLEDARSRWVLLDNDADERTKEDQVLCLLTAVDRLHDPYAPPRRRVVKRGFLDRLQSILINMVLQIFRNRLLAVTFVTTPPAVCFLLCYERQCDEVKSNFNFSQMAQTQCDEVKSNFNFSQMAQTQCDEVKSNGARARASVF